MLSVKTNYNYTKIEELLPKYYPAARPKIQEGSRSGPTTVFFLDMPWIEFFKMTDALMDLEVDACNVPTGEEGNSFAYHRNVKYGWLWDMFYEAEVEEI